MARAANALGALWLGALGGAAGFGCSAPAASMPDQTQASAPAAVPQPSALAALEQSTGLVATPEEERARLDALTADELARSLMRLPGVRDARVHLTQPARPAALDALVAPPKAAVLLLREPGAARVPEASVRALVAAAVASLTPEAVTVVQSELAPRPGAAASPLVMVGPFSVPRSSASMLRASLAAGLLLHLALAAALIAVVTRHRRATRGDADR